MRIEKVKVSDKPSKVSIEYRQRPHGPWEDLTLTSPERPRPELVSLLNSLRRFVCAFCELPYSYAERIEVHGVSYSYGGDKEVMGAVIMAVMRLTMSNGCLVLNTPHKASESYSEGPADAKALMPEDCAEILNEIIGEARLYVKGDRQQVEMDLEGEKKKHGKK